MLHKVKLQTGKHAQMLDITAQIEGFIKQEKVETGMV